MHNRAAVRRHKGSEAGKRKKCGDSKHNSNLLNAVNQQWHDLSQLR
jgi:hypothetical protein